MSYVFVDIRKSFSINELRRCGGRFAVTRSVSTSYDYYYDILVLYPFAQFVATVSLCFRNHVLPHHLHVCFELWIFFAHNVIR